MSHFRTLLRLFLLVTIAAGTVPGWADIQSTETSRPDDRFEGVRILKVAGVSHTDWSVELPASCPSCRLVQNRFTRGENAREIYFHFLTAGSTTTISGMHIRMSPNKVRAVWAGRTKIPFKKTDDGITIDVPCNGPTLSQLEGFQTLPADAVGDVTDQYTYLEGPAVSTRVEHADEGRRNGAYASGTWPAVQRQAALNLEFAAREAISALKIDRVMRERGLGTVLLMGFDTNFPTLSPENAHSDDPPHWHMHISWSQPPIIRQVGHFYIGPDGLITDDQVADVQQDAVLHFPRGETFTTRNTDNEPIYSQTVTPEGYFVIATSNASCRLSPVSKGFDSGIDVGCTNAGGHHRIRAEDDIHLGRLRVFIDDRMAEEHFYDPDSGQLKTSRINYSN